MFWLDRIFGEAEKQLAPKIASGKKLLIRDEKTASGRVHVGSMRALALHAALAERLGEAGIEHEFVYEINDFDPMDGLPVYLDQEIFGKYLGVPLCNIPSPEPEKAKNFAEYYAAEYEGAIRMAGFSPKFTRASTLYREGKMNDTIRDALSKVDLVKKIYKELTGQDRPENWYPINVICEHCGKLSTTKVTAFDGENVAYTCYPTAVDWTQGCGHAGTISPFDGNAKLLWKLDWAAKWKVYGVDIEGGGKDHYSKGGSRDYARRISEEVFGYPEPFGVPNEFFLVGGKKMSSSKGAGSAAKDVVELLPPHIFRLALYGKDINQQINFDPAGDTIPVLYDTYDRIAEEVWSGAHDDNTRLFTYITTEPWLFEPRFLPRFSQVAFMVQMPHLDSHVEFEKVKGSPLTELDKKELRLRSEYARVWLDRAADEEYKFILQETLPEAYSLTDAQRSALRAVFAYVEAHPVLDGQELHTALHDLRKQSGLEAKPFFGPMYAALLHKDHGPKMGWFLSVLPREFLLDRLKAAASA